MTEPVYPPMKEAMCYGRHVFVYKLGPYEIYKSTMNIINSKIEEGHHHQKSWPSSEEKSKKPPVPIPMPTSTCSTWPSWPPGFIIFPQDPRTGKLICN